MNTMSFVEAVDGKRQYPLQSSVYTVSTQQSSEEWTSVSDSIDSIDSNDSNDSSDSSCSSNVYVNAADKLFPYHVVLDGDFTIKMVGKKLPHVFNATKEELIGQRIDDIFSITQPVCAQWNRGWLILQDDESFRVEPSLGFNNRQDIRFKAAALHIGDDTSEIMIDMVPDASTVDELIGMNLTMKDLPAHSAHRDLIRLSEKLKKQEILENVIQESVTLPPIHRVLEQRESAEKALVKERKLLESLVPKHVAEGLRKGENVKPMVHQDVTFFFSDVVGFTDMCKQLYPWQIVGLLNRLYCVMDYLADRFNIFKVETIGDAYVCCSGLPHPDSNHAENIANFACSVSKCVRQVLSPVDGSPIQLRIGIHTGSAASGVVGVNNPRYCVFGDTVNVTARHESSGEAGRVHCSAATRKVLDMSGALRHFNCIERGLVEMKGKGKLRTFWLEPSESNPFIDEVGMKDLQRVIALLLEQTKFECELEKENSQKRCQLIGKLDSVQLQGKSQEIMGPILDIIRRELCNQALNGSKLGNKKSPMWQDRPISIQSGFSPKHFNGNKAMKK